MNAVMEHLYLQQVPLALTEWARVLSPSGSIVVLGVPDFEMTARLYLEGASGILSERFDLFHVYNYAHGRPEMECRTNWERWDPVRHLDTAPPGWLPQLHKAIYDAATLYAMFDHVDVTQYVVRYAYPGESHRLNLGVVGLRTETDPLAMIAAVPTIERFVDLTTLELVADVRVAPGIGTGLSRYALNGEGPPSSFARRAARALSKALARTGR